MKNQKLKIAGLALLVATVVTSQAFAGAANTLVQCKNAAGKIVLEGDVPGDIAEFSLKAKLKNKKGRAVNAELYSRLDQGTSSIDENGRLTIFQDLEKGVYAFQADSLRKEGAESISLYAIPKTVKVKRSGERTTSKFKAKLSVRNVDAWINADVVCTTDYSI